VEIAIAPAQFGHAQVGNRTVLGEELTPIPPTAGQLLGAAPGQVFIALQAQIGAQFFFQGCFDDLLDGGEDNVLHVEAQVVFHVARQALAIDHLQIVIQVAAIMQLLGMAHRGIPP
jgi:hypothetical protein